ncbi:Gag polyprotein, partial [Heterocephalus glaber]
GPPLALQETEQGHYVYIPFTTSDLYNWKHQNPPFSEKPQALISLLESIFHTHGLTWDDCQQLLQALFTSEERKRIRGQAVRLVLEVVNQDQQVEWEQGLPQGTSAQKAELIALTKALELVHQLQSELHDKLRKTMPGPSEKPLQPLPYKPRDLVFIHRFDSKTLEPCWKGPFPIVLVSPSAVKVAGHSAWIHHSHLKVAPPEEAMSTWRIDQNKEDPLKIRL